MDVGTSKGLESFLTFLRETSERHRMAEADRAEAEAATQDLLHALEAGKRQGPRAGRGWGSRFGKCGGSAGRRRTSRSRPGPWWIG